MRTIDTATFELCNTRAVYKHKTILPMYVYLFETHGVCTPRVRACEKEETRERENEPEKR